MKRHIIAAGLLGFSMLAATPAFATPSAQKFVTTATIANKFEIDSSKIALEKSQNADIKQFAQQMIDDHSKAADGLQSAVGSANANLQVPSDLDSSHTKLLNRLKMDKAGKDFDKEYVADQVSAHKDAVKLFTSYSKNGDNDALKQFATQTLPTLQEHQDHIKQINSAM